jgi:hypothetical protein
MRALVVSFAKDTSGNAIDYVCVCMAGGSFLLAVACMLGLEPSRLGNKLASVLPGLQSLDHYRYRLRTCLDPDVASARYDAPRITVAAGPRQSPQSSS